MTKQERQRLAAALSKAIQAAGGPAEVARFISDRYESITTQAVSAWKLCPPRRAVQVAAAVAARGGNIAARDIRPDIYEAIAA